MLECVLFKKRLSRLENLQTQGLVILTDTKDMFPNHTSYFEITNYALRYNLIEYWVDIEIRLEFWILHEESLPNKTDFVLAL